MGFHVDELPLVQLLFPFADYAPKGAVELLAVIRRFLASDPEFRAAWQTAQRIKFDPGLCLWLTPSPKPHAHPLLQKYDRADGLPNYAFAFGGDEPDLPGPSKTGLNLTYHFIECPPQPVLLRRAPNNVPR
jgi:hypothetical protein